MRWDAVRGHWLFNAQVARHTEENSIGPASAAGDIIEYRDTANDFFQTGGFRLIQQEEFTRDFFGGAASWLTGTHELNLTRSSLLQLLCKLVCYVVSNQLKCLYQLLLLKLKTLLTVYQVVQCK